MTTRSRKPTAKELKALANEVEGTPDAGGEQVLRHAHTGKVHTVSARLNQGEWELLQKLAVDADLPTSTILRVALKEYAKRQAAPGNTALESSLAVAIARSQTLFEMLNSRLADVEPKALRSKNSDKFLAEVERFAEVAAL